MKRVKCTQGLRRFLNGSSSTQNKGVRKELLEVITVRTWKEYVEESVLIVFSVVLALLLTTLFQKLHENKQTREVLHELREELITNKKSEEIQLTYHLRTYSLLTNIYANQQRITKAEDEISKVLESWESRKPENLRTTLILIKDNYLRWAVDRAPGLLKRYQEAIEKLSNY
jgi:hypothetical protein